MVYCVGAFEKRIKIHTDECKHAQTHAQNALRPTHTHAHTVKSQILVFFVSHLPEASVIYVIYFFAVFYLLSLSDAIIFHMRSFVDRREKNSCALFCFVKASFVRFFFSIWKKNYIVSFSFRRPITKWFHFGSFILWTKCVVFSLLVVEICL